MDFFTRMFTSMFRSSANRYKMRIRAQVTRATVGKVQAKSMQALEKLDQKAYKATDGLTGLNKTDKNNPATRNAPGARGGGAGGGGAGGGAMARGGGKGGGMPQQSNVSRKQQGSSEMGKGKKNKRQQAMMVSCMNCGSDLQSDWDMCPYCGTPVGQVGSSAPQPLVGTPAPIENNGEKTVALNLDQLNQSEQRSVVGWIVAQNGNHRGEDFRIYDGKNIIGTAADCDIVITDPYLSAKHCTIRHENGNFQLTDLDSMNGTFVNQKRITKSDLIDNDTIRLGRTEFKFKSLF